MAMFCSIAGSLGVPVINGPPPNQQAVGLPVNGQAALAASALPALVATSSGSEPVGDPSECLLLKNMFDPNTEVCASLILFCALSKEVLNFKLCCSRSRILIWISKRKYKKSAPTSVV